MQWVRLRSRYCSLSQTDHSKQNSDRSDISGVIGEVADAVGMRSGGLKAAEEAVWQECASGSFPGAAYLVLRRGQIVMQGACGIVGVERREPVEVGTLFDLASVTKPLTAAVMALCLAEDGRVSVLQKVGEFFPERKLPHLAEVSLKHLLTHTSGLPAWIDLYTGIEMREEALERLLSTPLGASPGSHFEYSCLGYILLGAILERVAGESLADFLRREVWGPLGMSDTGYGSHFSCGRVFSSTLNCPARPRELVGEVHDGNAWRMNGISGNAGLFSNILDLSRYARAVFDPDGSGVPLGRLARETYVTSQIPPEVGYQSFGWFCQGSDYLPGGDFLPSDTIGHTGFTGTSFLLVPSESLAMILLTNRICSDTDGSEICRTRRKYHNLVASAII